MRVRPEPPADDTVGIHIPRVCIHSYDCCIFAPLQDAVTVAFKLRWHQLYSASDPLSTRPKERIVRRFRPLQDTIDDIFAFIYSLECVPIGAQVQLSLSAPYRAFIAGAGGGEEQTGQRLREVGVTSNCLVNVSFELPDYDFDAA